MLIKNAEALERLEQVDTLVVDKTGTLTEGKPRVVAVVPAAGFDRGRHAGAGREPGASSEHPLAAAIVARRARTRSLPLRERADFDSRHRQGRAGTSRRTHAWRWATRALMQELGVALGELAATADALRARRRDGDVPGGGRRARPALIAVADPIKPTAAGGAANSCARRTSASSC